MEKIDKVKRPDHYRCLDCGERFNDAKFKKQTNQGIYTAIAGCPECDSSRIKISWWKRKDEKE